MSDSFQWLESIGGQKVDSWVEEENSTTLERLAGDLRFNGLCSEFEEELEKEGQLVHFHRPNIILRGDFIYEIWQDREHVHGVLRRQSLVGSSIDEAEWDVLLDLDTLCKIEGGSWYIHSFQASRFSPSGNRLLLGLTNGGSDSMEFREFDLIKREFVLDGFNVPARIHRAEWLSEDSLVICSPLNDDEKTNSNYSRVVRLWSRGQMLELAKVIHEVPVTHTLCNTTRLETYNHTWVFLISAASLDDITIYLVSMTGGLTPIKLPKDMGWNVPVNGYLVGVGRSLIIPLVSDWVVGDSIYASGSVVSIDLVDTLTNNGDLCGSVSLVFQPEDDEAIGPSLNLSSSKDCIYINVMKNVASRLIRATKLEPESCWSLEDITLPEMGRSILPMFSNPCSNSSLVIFESFLIPPTLHLVGNSGGLIKLRDSKPCSDFPPLKVKQHFAAANDGTDIPYFVIRPVNDAMNRSTPTLFYSYGAWGTPVVPNYDYFYFGLTIRRWLQQGGALVVANPRGGGEYGEKWHLAGKKTKRQTTYNDLYSVCEAVFSSGLTSPRYLGMIGGSGGGLTAGVTFTQRPELSNATISAAGVLDMLRFHKLGQGAFGMHEYGDPENPEHARVLRAISPYHNLDQDKQYYEPLLLAATLDDRVHPGHVRKMAAKMHSLGLSALFYEAREGGHMMAMNNSERAFNAALQMVYLLQRLVD